MAWRRKARLTRYRPLEPGGVQCEQALPQVADPDSRDACQCEHTHTGERVCVCMCVFEHTSHSQPARGTCYIVVTCSYRVLAGSLLATTNRFQYIFDTMINICCRYSISKLLFYYESDNKIFSFLI